MSTSPKNNSNKSVSLKKIIYLPVVLLLLNASVHFALVHFGFLSKWNGGGFGMFADVHSRRFRIHLLDENKKFLCYAKVSEIDYYKANKVNIDNLRKNPNSKYVNILIQQIKKTEWVKFLDRTHQYECLKGGHSEYNARFGLSSIKPHEILIETFDIDVEDDGYFLKLRKINEHSAKF